jgi:hypothetical protein
MGVMKWTHASNQERENIILIKKKNIKKLEKKNIILSKRNKNNT